MTYWVKSMQSPEELKEALRKSNAPFTDSRSDDEKALYSQQQADNRRMRADRTQFERYRARLGDDAPKTFSQFRKLKKQGGEKWEDLQKLYRKRYQDQINYAKAVDIFNDYDAPNNAHITAEQVYENMLTSEIGREYLKYAENLPERIKFDYISSPYGLYGEQRGNAIVIYIRNNASVERVARTVIHECTHHKYGIGESQWAECVCVAHELMHKYNRKNLTVAEKRRIIKAVKEVYPEHKWRRGGTIYGRRKNH